MKSDPASVRRPLADNARRSLFARKAGAYVLVLTTAMLVATIGLAALEVTRVERQTRMEGRDALQARYLAQSAIEMGFAMIAADSNWRITLGAGTWIFEQPLGTGTLSLSAEFINAGDGDTSDDPVELIGEGVVGDAVQRARVIVGPATDHGGLVVQKGSWERVGG